MSFECPDLHCGRYSVSAARTAADIDAAQAFRARTFGLAGGQDGDAWDAQCDHIMIHGKSDGALVCCYRMLAVTPDCLARSYAAQFYDVAALEGFDGPCLEIGRFCMDPARRDPDILRLAWAVLTACVDAQAVTLLFGCSSFQGTDPARYSDAFAFLRTQALAPARWAPGRKADAVHPFAQAPPGRGDRRRALKQLPPLLRTYIGMGGWVSDHAVIDRQMNTLHVFTAVETAAIPHARQRRLRALCQQVQLTPKPRLK